MGLVQGTRLGRYEMRSKIAEGVLSLLTALLVTPVYFYAQQDNWPPVSYLKNDYKAVSIVAHVHIQQAEITGRVGGYENWKITGIVVESFKGRFKKGEPITYFHGAEAGLKRDYFNEEKIVFLLAERDPKQKEVHYSVLENSTLKSNPDRLIKLRLIRRQALKARGTHSVRSAMFID